jgi:hypothetical protein
MSPPQPLSSPALTRPFTARRKHTYCRSPRALAEEVRGSGVRVSCLAPGATDTGLAAQAGMAGTRLFRRGVIDVGRVGPGRARWLAAGQDPDHSRPAKPRPGVLRAPVPARPCHPGVWLPAGLDATRRFAGHLGPPAGSGRSEPGIDARAWPAGHPEDGPLNTTLRNEPLPWSEAHTAAVRYWNGPFGPACWRSADRV